MEHESQQCSLLPCVLVHTCYAQAQESCSVPALNHKAQHTRHSHQNHKHREVLGEPKSWSLGVQTTKLGFKERWMKIHVEVMVHFLLNVCQILTLRFLFRLWLHLSLQKLLGKDHQNLGMAVTGRPELGLKNEKDLDNVIGKDSKTRPPFRDPGEANS